jgi:tRNA nucleotidyltransferase (CCA-adding enzyme)
MSVEDAVLARIRPSPDEEKALSEMVHELLAKVDMVLKSKGWDAKPFLSGSVAKGTHLTGADVDLFVAFPPDLPREHLEARGLALGELLDRGLHMYAEHPYTRGWFKGFQVEIVPCYRITDASQRMSAVDRTPLHVDYVLGHLNDGQADEVRLLKAWSEGVGVYGAEAKIGGFSGYLCELLAIKYGTFRKVLEASLSWRRGEAITLDHAGSRAFEEPLVVVDPVDPNRNVASAVRTEQMATFVHAAREYLRSPSERFYFPKPLKPLTLPKLRALAKRRAGQLLAIVIPAPGVTEDILYPQLRKAHRSFLELFGRYDFSVLDSRFDVAGREAVFLFEFAVGSLPRVQRHEGPPVWVRNAKDFIEKWSGSARTIAGPFLLGDRWTVDVVREATDAAALVKVAWREMSLGKDLEKSAKKSLKTLSGVAALGAAYAEAWTKLFDKRFPWER